VAGLLTPLAMGALAGTPALTVGGAMMTLVVPSGLLLLLLGAATMRAGREGRRKAALAYP
jgi:hypothetical protein